MKKFNENIVLVIIASSLALYFIASLFYNKNSSAKESKKELMEKCVELSSVNLHVKISDFILNNKQMTSSQLDSLRTESDKETKKTVSRVIDKHE